MTPILFVFFQKISCPKKVVLGIVVKIGQKILWSLVFLGIFWVR